MPFDCDEAIGIATSFIAHLFRALVAFLLSYESPDFIAFYIPNFYVSDEPGHDLLALLASENQQAHDCVAVKFGDALYGTDAGSLDEQLECKRGLIHGNRHGAKRLVMVFGEGLAALGTAITLQPVPVFPEPFGFAVSTGATHD